MRDVFDTMIDPRSVVDVEVQLLRQLQHKRLSGRSGETTDAPLNMRLPSRHPHVKTAGATRLQILVSRQHCSFSASHPKRSLRYRCREGQFRVGTSLSRQTVPGQERPFDAPAQIVDNLTKADSG